MPEAFVDDLRSLRDVQGVLGSFVLDDSGSLVGRDLPAIFDADTLNSVGSRVQRLLEALGEEGGGSAHLTLRYASHKVYLHRLERGIVGVISTPDASSPTMHMALTLVGRRVGKGLGNAGVSSASVMPATPPVQSMSQSTPSVALVASQPSSAPISTSPSSKVPLPQSMHPRLYRGRVVD